MREAIEVGNRSLKPAIMVGIIMDGIGSVSHTKHRVLLNDPDCRHPAVEPFEVRQVCLHVGDGRHLFLERRLNAEAEDHDGEQAGDHRDEDERAKAKEFLCLGHKEEQQQESDAHPCRSGVREDGADERDDRGE